MTQASQCPTGHDSTVLKPYFLPSSQLGVGFQKSTGGSDLKRSTFPSNLRALPPYQHLENRARAKPKHATYYLIFYEVFLPTMGMKQRSLNYPRWGRQQSTGLCLLEWSAEAYFTFLLLAKIKSPA